MPEVVADRFVRCGATWLDLASGCDVTLRVVPAGSRRDELAWNARCAALANLRHPLLNPLIDYGPLDNHRLFECYASYSPVRTSGRTIDRLITHALRFLHAHTITLRQPDVDVIVRRVEPCRGSLLRPLGVVLQLRPVYEAIADALDTAWPAGVSVVSVDGAPHSGLRTTRVMAARLARLRGYVPIDAHVLERHRFLADMLVDRHVCVLADQPFASTGCVRALFERLGSASARRHILLIFSRPETNRSPRWIAVERMGGTAMTAMVFVDAECGPKHREISDAVRIADGRPGAFLEHLGSRAYQPIRPTHLMIHEIPQAYGARAPTDAPVASSAVDDNKSGALCQRSISRANALVQRGRHGVARRVLSRATRMLLGRGSVNAAAEAAVHLGYLALHRGLLDLATGAFEEARQAAPASLAATRASIGIGLVRIDRGRLVEAEAVLRTAALSAASEDPRIQVQAICALARCLYWMDRLDEARLALNNAHPIDGVAETSFVLTMRSRIELAEGLIPAAVRSARAALEIAKGLNDGRTHAAACRTLGVALAAAGDDAAAVTQIQHGLSIAAAAHLPLAAARLRLTLAEVRGAAHKHEAERTVTRIIARGYPPLLQAAGRVALARLNEADLDARTRAFIASSGALLLKRSILVTPTNPLTDLESFLQVGHTAPDDRGAIEQIVALLQAKLRASTVIVVGIAPERRTLATIGRAWTGDPHIAWRAAGSGVGIPIDPSLEPSQAAEPIRYSGEVVGALAVRWTAGIAVDAPRASSIVRIAALALASHVRAVLDPCIPTAGKTSSDDLLGDSQPASTLREAIARAARAPFPVLIQGESGSGKELVARTIHRCGSRRDRRFCALNCAALTDELIEAELFGHARGAFTGAVGERAGLFEEADGGTLFLDEIGELSPRAQAKLLRVLQDGEVRRVGENMPRRVDVRIVAATNRRLDQEAAAGRFRLDLRFRLDVIRIEVPPLRERASDVPLLASRFWNEAAGRVGTRATLGPEAVAALARYEWPGNVRELQNVIAWIAVQSPRRGRIGPAALPAHIARASPPDQTTFEAAREEFERRFVKAALAKADGQRGRAAEALGVTRQGLAKMMRRLRIE